MQPNAVDRHEADLTRLCWFGDVEHGHAGGPVSRARRFLVAVRAGLRFVVVPLVRHFGLREHIPAVNEKQEVVVHLQMEAPGVGRILDVVDRLRPGRVANVDDGKTFRTDMTDIGVTVTHHDLLAVGAAGLIGVADQTHVARVARLQQVSVGHVVGPPARNVQLSPCIPRCRARR